MHLLLSERDCSPTHNTNNSKGLKLASLYKLLLLPIAHRFFGLAKSYGRVINKNHARL